jgi:hypothetical protein
MNATLRLVTTQPKSFKNNFITPLIIDDKFRLFKIININHQEGNCEIKCIFSQETHLVTMDNIQFIIRLLAVSDKTTLPIIHRDVNDILVKLFKDSQELIGDFINNKINITIKGEEYKTFSLPKLGESIEIVNLDKIDAYHLHSKQSRIGNIKDIIGMNQNIKSSTFKVELTDGRVLNCKRLDFKTIDRSDYKKLFKIKNNDEIKLR